MGNRIKNSKAVKTGRTKVEEAKDILSTIILSHIPDENSLAKVRYLSIMIRKIIDTL